MVKSLLLLGTGLVLGVVSVPLWPAQAEVAGIHRSVQDAADQVAELAPDPTQDDDVSSQVDRTPAPRPNKRNPSALDLAERRQEVEQMGERLKQYDFEGMGGGHVCQGVLSAGKAKAEVLETRVRDSQRKLEHGAWLTRAV